MIEKNSRGWDRYGTEWPGPRPITEWRDEEILLRTTRYEKNRASTIEQLELTDALLGPMRAEAMRRGFNRDEHGFWDVPQKTKPPNRDEEEK